MKIKFRNSDGLVLAMGHLPNLAAGNGETVEDFDGFFPSKRIDFYKRTAKNTIEEIPQSEQDKLTAEKNFSVALMTHRIGQVFSGAAVIGLAPYLGALQSYCMAKNFSGAKDYINGLVALSKATSEQGASIKSVILEQGIDLDNL